MCMAITTNLAFCIATIHKSNIHSPHVYSSIQRIDAQFNLWHTKEFLMCYKLWHATLEDNANTVD